MKKSSVQHLWAVLLFEGILVVFFFYKTLENLTKGDNFKYYFCIINSSFKSINFIFIIAVFFFIKKILLSNSTGSLDSDIHTACSRHIDIVDHTKC